MNNRKKMSDKVRTLEKIVNGDGEGVEGVTTEIGNLQRENKFDSKMGNVISSV